MIDLLRILIGPTVWLGAFSAVYGLQGLGCALGWQGVEAGGVSLLRVAVVAAWLLTVAVQAAIIPALAGRRFGSPSPFVRRVSLVTAAVGLVAALWSLFPAAATSACL